MWPKSGHLLFVPSADLKQSTRASEICSWSMGRRHLILSSFHPIKFKCALRQSVDLWPRAVFAQLESLTSFGFFHIRVPLAVLFPCMGQCAQEAVKGGQRSPSSMESPVPLPVPSLPCLSCHHLCTSVSTSVESGCLPHRTVWSNEIIVKQKKVTKPNKTSGWHIMSAPSVNVSVPKGLKQGPAISLWSCRGHSGGIN